MFFLGVYCRIIICVTNLVILDIIIQLILGILKPSYISYVMSNYILNSNQNKFMLKNAYIYHKNLKQG